MEAVSQEDKRRDSGDQNTVCCKAIAAGIATALTGDMPSIEIDEHNQNKWEVAFIWQFEINPDYPVDVFLEIESSTQTATLAERDVKVQFVY